jgi:hypothetical protein
MLGKVFTIAVVLFISNISFAQDDTVRAENDGYEYVSVYNSLNGFGVTTLNIYKDGRSIFTLDEDMRIESVSFEDIKGNGKKSTLILSYTGGAHCCFILYVGEPRGNSFIISDTIFLGDAMFEPKDLNNDGKMELETSFVGFAYEFTSFAGSQFPILIYGYKDGKVQMVNEDFKKFVYDDIAEFEKEMLSAYRDYDCPEAEDEYWGSNAGELQGFLAAIVFDYASINEVSKGYDLIDKYYKCPNKEKFKDYLRDNYNLN